MAPPSFAGQADCRLPREEGAARSPGRGRGPLGAALREKTYSGFMDFLDWGFLGFFGLDVGRYCFVYFSATAQRVSSNASSVIRDEERTQDE